MIGELNAGHAYVGGGELPEVRTGPAGTARRRVRARPQDRFFQIDEILHGENWDPKLRSPLTEVGVNVKEGDYIVAVNGQPTSDVKNIYELLVNTAGKPVALTVNAKPTAEGRRDVVVTPIADEADLYYYDWVQDNIKKVTDATGGKVGYLHVPDMQAARPERVRQALTIRSCARRR